MTGHEISCPRARAGKRMEIGRLVRLKYRGNGHPRVGVLLRIEYNVNRRRKEATVMWNDAKWNESYWPLEKLRIIQ